MPLTRPQFKPAMMMTAVAIITMGLAWGPLFFLLVLFALAVFSLARFGTPRIYDGLLAATPLVLWAGYFAVIVPLAVRWHGCSGFGLVVNFFCYSALAMLICETVALWRCLRGATPMLWAAVALNWSWLYYLVILQ